MPNHYPYNSARKKRITARLIERDGLVCCFCGELIDPLLKRNDDMALSVDHIIPMREDGNSRLENLRLAHRWCNSKDRRTRAEKLEARNRKGK